MRWKGLSQLFALWNRISLVQQFMLTALVILLLTGLVLGWFVAHQIQMGVIRKTASETSLYVDSFLDPELQELTISGTLSPSNIKRLDQLVHGSPLGQHVVSVKVIDPQGRILYSTYPSQIGQDVAIDEELDLALSGKLFTEICTLEDELGMLESQKWDKLIETFAPVTQHGTQDVVGVVQFYQTLDSLNSEIRKAQLSSIGMVGGQSVLVFLLLSTFIKRASNTIDQQRGKLRQQVSSLTDLLKQNEVLGERIHKAVSHAITLNENFLKRIRAELHDGPVQELGYAILRLDSLKSPKYLPPELLADGHEFKGEMSQIETSLQHAISTIRETATAMGLPNLEQADVRQTAELAVQVHEQRTGSEVQLICPDISVQASLSSKITLYRLVQESLNNAFRHAGGINQQVIVKVHKQILGVEISDQGKGFDLSWEIDQNQHLGLAGMRERVESLGGLFSISSQVGHGTRITASIPIQAEYLMEGKFGAEILSEIQSNKEAG